MKYIVLLFLISYLFPAPLPGQIDLPETLYSISVVGAVKNPGVYRLPPTSRLSEVVKLANAEAPVYVYPTEEILAAPQKSHSNPYQEYKELIEESYSPEESSSRNIILKRDDESIRIDLQKFFRLGNERENPYLEDGDIIIVHPQTEKVTVYGAINKPGNYEIVPGDRLSDIIALALGFTDAAYLNALEIIRYKEDHINTETIIVNYRDIIENSTAAQDILLQNDDRIMIRLIPEYHEDPVVYIRGEVYFPGIYVITENSTTLSALITMAGGITEKADLKRSYLQKREEIEYDPEFERLKSLAPSDMTPLEYEYQKAKINEIQAKISVDFESLLKGNSDIDPFLQNNDYIYIPGQINSVIVSGHVKNPSSIAYEKGLNYLDYIERAGGFSWRVHKSKIRIIRGETGEWIKPDKNTVIYASDMIFVPEKPEYDYWQITREAIATLSQIATIIIVIQTVTSP
ncbi:MAG: SLBB domain-containing protein [Candidatus Cloacimonetes bacterium]|nr:SLBB domain-containing protein [Candidatus Cloacimonadota bacterium]